MRDETPKPTKEPTKLRMRGSRGIPDPDDPVPVRGFWGGNFRKGGDGLGGAGDQCDLLQGMSTRLCPRETTGLRIQLVVCSRKRSTAIASSPTSPLLEQNTPPASPTSPLLEQNTCPPPAPYMSNFASKSAKSAFCRARYGDSGSPGNALTSASTLRATPCFKRVSGIFRVSSTA